MNQCHHYDLSDIWSITNLKKQKSEGNKIHDSHSMDHAPNGRMWPYKYPDKYQQGRNQYCHDMLYSYCDSFSNQSRDR